MIFAHAFGDRYDLPIPLDLFLAAGVAVVLVSYLLVQSRTVDGDADPGADGVPPATSPVAVLGVLAWLGLILAGLFGTQELSDNIVPTAFWVVVWIVVPMSCGLIGDWTKWINPFVALASLGDRPRLRRLVLGTEAPLPWPTWLGWWPAVVGFIVLACGELVFNVTATRPEVTAAGLLAYGFVTTVAGLLFGPSWLSRGEVFTVLFATWGRLGYFRFGAAGPRGFGGGLRVPFEPVVSRTAFVLMLLISVSFDGVLSTPQWSRLEARVVGSPPDTMSLELFRVASFLGLALIIALVFGAFALKSSRVGQHDEGLFPALSGLLPSLMPIAFGYLLAHYLQYVLVNAQLLFPLIGNPLGTDAWPLSLPYPFSDSFDPKIDILPTSFYWYFGAAAIVAGHVFAVVLAHRHLGRTGSEASAARRSEYPWLVAMVSYTVFSLWLIAQPLVEETTPGTVHEGSAVRAAAVVAALR